jgi:DNA-binding transcriptional LysR family regulator
LDFKQLEAFVQVVRLKSFSLAAQALFLTQPTVSTHISGLEKEIGVKLINRTPREALPTAAGETLYEYAVEILMLCERAAAHAAGKKEERVIVIAASTLPCKHLLPGMMSAFRASSPGASFSVVAGDSLGVVRAVSRGEADMGMTGTKIETPGCRFVPWLDDCLVAAIPDSAPYGHLKDGADAGELAGLPFIIRESGSGTRRETEDYLRSRGIDPGSLSVAACLGDPDAVLESVSMGLGVSIVSRLSATGYEKAGAVRVLSLGGGPLLRRLWLCRHAKRRLSPEAEAFWQYALEHRPLF